MEHQLNEPIEVCEDGNVEIPEDAITLDFFYHRDFCVGCCVSVFLHGDVFHGVVTNSSKHFNCFLLSVKILESFKLRMVEQVIRIERSQLSPQEWVKLYADKFPER